MRRRAPVDPIRRRSILAVSEAAEERRQGEFFAGVYDFAGLETSTSRLQALKKERLHAVEPLGREKRGFPGAPAAFAGSFATIFG
jgi:hypothetical protein